MPGPDHPGQTTPEADAAPEALDALWQSAPPIDEQRTWQQIAGQLPARAGGGRRFIPISGGLRWFRPRGYARQIATVAASLAVVGLIVGGVFTLGQGSAEASLLERADELSAATTAALDDGDLSDAERDSLNALVAALVAKVESGDDLSEMSATEIAQLIETLSGVQSTLTSLAAGDEAADAVVAAVASAPATVAAESVGAGTIALSSVPSSVQGAEQGTEDENTFAIADLPITVQTSAGDVVIDGSAAGLGVTSVSTIPGWTSEIETDEAGEAGVDFRDGTTRITLRAEIEDGRVRVRTTTEPDRSTNDGVTAVVDVDATPALQNFAVESAGSVILELSETGLRIVSVQPNAGWTFDTEVEDGGREVRVDFRDDTLRVRFKAELEDGNVRVETEIRIEDDGENEGNSGPGNSDDDAVDDDSRGADSGSSNDDDDNDNDDSRGSNSRSRNDDNNNSND